MRTKRRKPFIVFLGIIILLVFLHYTRITKPLENFLLYAAKPVTSLFYNISSRTNDAFERSQGIENPEQLIDKLNEKVAELIIDKADYQEVVEENIRLKELLSFSSDNDYKLVLAGIIAQENFNRDNGNLIINKGSLDGLSSGLAIVNEKGILVGKIVEVKDSISRICLSISPDCEFASSVQNSTRTQGLVSGSLGLVVKMSYIPQIERISEGDIVITSGLGGNIPRGLVIGTIVEVIKEDNEVWQEAIIEPPLDFDNLTIVSAVIP